MTPLDLTSDQIIRPGRKVLCARVESERSRKAFAAREAKRLRALRERFL